MLLITTRYIDRVYRTTSHYDSLQYSRGLRYVTAETTAHGRQGVMLSSFSDRGSISDFGPQCEDGDSWNN